MARKDGSTLKSRQMRLQGVGEASSSPPLSPFSHPLVKAERHKDSWAAIGIDTSMTSICAVGVGYDAVLDKFVGPEYSDLRWFPDDDYFKRLADAAKGYELILDLLGSLTVLTTRTFVAVEEPWFYGATKRAQSAWLKQQAEIAGSFKGGLARYGFLNIYEINNAQWAKVLREEGIDIKTNVKDPDRKWKVKRWAISAFGLPDLPDLVASKSGAKIPRPESGYGAKAKPVQPNDIYDAAACCAWMQNQIEAGAVS